MSITQTSYPNLYGPTSDFAVLAQTGISFGANNAITNGVYGSYLDFENHVIFENKPADRVIAPLQLTQSITA